MVGVPCQLPLAVQLAAGHAVVCSLISRLAGLGQPAVAAGALVPRVVLAFRPAVRSSFLASANGCGMSMQGLWGFRELAAKAETDSRLTASCDEAAW